MPKRSSEEANGEVVEKLENEGKIWTEADKQFLYEERTKEPPTPYEQLIPKLKRTCRALRIKVHYLKQKRGHTGSEDEEPAPKRRATSRKSASARAADADFQKILPRSPKTSATNEDKPSLTSEDEDIAKILQCMSGSQVPHVGPTSTAPSGTTEPTKRVDSPATSPGKQPLQIHYAPEMQQLASHHKTSRAAPDQASSSNASDSRTSS